MWHRAVSSRLLSSAAAVGAACSFQQRPEGSWRCSGIRSKQTSCRCEAQKTTGSKSVDVVVLGGGIVGASTALYLAEAGSSVLLVETQALGSGATGMSAATVASTGAGDGSNAVWSMTHWTMRALRELQGQADAGDHDLDCAFTECGAMELLRTEKELQRALASVEELQRHGYEVQVISPSAAEQLEPALKGAPGLLGVMHMPQSGYADPCKLMQALEKKATDAGVDVWEGWEAVAASRQGHNECGKTWLVELVSRSRNSGSNAERVSCNHVVLATGAWANATGKIFGLEVPVARVKAQMWSATARNATATKLSHVIYSMASHLFWAEYATKDMSTGTPNKVTHSAMGERYCYHVYGRPSCAGAQEVFFGGDRLPLSLDQAPSDYDVRQPEQQENFKHISDSLPALELQDADPGGWCGVVGSSLHGGVLIGEVAFLPGLWLCTGFGGSGFAQGIGAAKAVSEWITAGSDMNKTNFPALQLAADPNPWIRSSSAL